MRRAVSVRRSPDDTARFQVSDRASRGIARVDSNRRPGIHSPFGLRFRCAIGNQGRNNLQAEDTGCEEQPVRTGTDSGRERGEMAEEGRRSSQPLLLSISISKTICVTGVPFLPYSSICPTSTFSLFTLPLPPYSFAPSPPLSSAPVSSHRGPVACVRSKMRRARNQPETKP